MRYLTKYAERHKEPRRRQSTLTIPERASPVVKLVFSEMKRRGFTYDRVEAGSGVLRTDLKAWRNKNKPSLESIEAVLGFLDFDFVPVPRGTAIPPEVLAELQPIAEKLGLSLPAAIKHLVAIVANIHASPAAQRSA